MYSRFDHIRGPVGRSIPPPLTHTHTHNNKNIFKNVAPPTQQHSKAFGLQNSTPYKFQHRFIFSSLNHLTHAGETEL